MPTLRLATWNLERPSRPSRLRAQSIREWIAKIDADVWVLTETTDAFTPGDAYDAVSAVHPDRPAERGERWVTIWSRLPVLATLTTSDTSRTAAAVIALPGSGRGIVYGTVLPWLGSAWRGYPSAGGRAFAAALDAQAADWLRYRWNEPDAELFVLGDFNQDLVGWPPRYYGSRANRAHLESVLETLNLVAVTGGLGDPVRRGSAPCACIDHICISRGSSWSCAYTMRWPETERPLKGKLSDHFGIAAALHRATADQA